MSDRTVSDLELRENARLAADEVIQKIRGALDPYNPEKLECLSGVLTALDQCATEPG